MNIVQDLFALHGRFEGHFHNALDLVLIVFQRFVDITAAVFIDPGFLIAKVKTTHQFANHHDINAVSDHFRLKR